MKSGPFMNTGFKHPTPVSPLTLNSSPHSGERGAASEVAQPFVHLSILPSARWQPGDLGFPETSEASPSPLNGERAGNGNHAPFANIFNPANPSHRRLRL